MSYSIKFEFKFFFSLSLTLIYTKTSTDARTHIFMMIKLSANFQWRDAPSPGIMVILSRTCSSRMSLPLVLTTIPTTCLFFLLPWLLISHLASGLRKKSFGSKKLYLIIFAGTLAQAFFLERKDVIEFNSLIKISISKDNKRLLKTTLGQQFKI